ncbi:MAG: hypothetical protein OXF83_05155 [Anaerolineaceae bacterium]|nr:hypothetical protein [Anaerolineaceae bacterium]
MWSVLLAAVEFIMWAGGAILFVMREWRWRGRLLHSWRARALCVLLWLPAPARWLMADLWLSRAQSRELALAAIRQLELALILSVCLIGVALYLSAPSDEGSP